jgi:hypothetical protein
MTLKPQTQPRLSLTEAYHATQRWLDHIGLHTAMINEPADGVVELRSSTHIARIRINTGPVNQRAVLALLRVAEETDLTPLLFSATGFSNGAIGFSASQNVGLFDLATDGEIIPINKAANQLMSVTSRCHRSKTIPNRHRWRKRRTRAIGGPAPAVDRPIIRAPGCVLHVAPTSPPGPAVVSCSGRGVPPPSCRSGRRDRRIPRNEWDLP